MENLIDSLKNLGLSRYEAKAYIGLTKIITGNADEIAEISDLPRSRVYDILNGLEKKGFVSIQRQRPLKYEAVEPNVIFKKEKEELISELNKTEQKLEEYYTNQISEIQAPVWLIHYPENIIEKEMSLIKKAEKSLTMRIGFLLPGEGELMVKVMNNLSKNVKIRILANPECCVDDEKIDIVKIFENNKHTNLEIIPAELPLIKILICDGKELFGTFANLNKVNNSVYSKTAIGVFNKYEDICSNFDYHFIKQFNMFQTIHE